MAIRVKKGATRIEWLPVTTSTALAKDTLVEWTSNLIAGADDNDTDLVGIISKEIASTDADYAKSRLVPVRVPTEKHVVYEAPYTGSPAVGAEYGISDSTTVDAGDTSNKVFRVTKVNTARTTVEGYLKINQGLY